MRDRMAELISEQQTRIRELEGEMAGFRSIEEDYGGATALLSRVETAVQEATAVRAQLADQARELGGEREELTAKLAKVFLLRILWKSCRCCSTQSSTMHSTLPHRRCFRSD